MAGSNLMMFGQCCTILSVWGIVQLTIMGILFLMEPVILFEEAAPVSNEEFSTYEEFKTVTKEGFRSIAMNCFLSAGLYVITLCLSLAAMKKAKKDEARALIEAENDDFEINPWPRNLHSLDMSEPVSKKGLLL